MSVSVDDARKKERMLGRARRVGGYGMTEDGTMRPYARCGCGLVFLQEESRGQRACLECLRVDRAEAATRCRERAHRRRAALVSRPIRRSLARARRCVYCGHAFGDQETRALDHVVPVCQGGTGDISNIVPACWGCNTRKGGRTPEQAGMRMVSC